MKFPTRVLWSAAAIAAVIILSCITDPIENPYQKAPKMLMADTVHVWFGDTLAGDELAITIENNIEADSFSLDTATLPAGLAFNRASGALTGVPAAPAGAYTLTIRAINEWGESARELTVIVHPENPDKPSHIHHKQDSAIVSWAAVEQAKFYRIYVSKHIDGSFEYLRQITATNTTVGRPKPDDEVAYYYVTTVSESGFESKPSQTLLVSFAGEITTLSVTAPQAQEIVEGASFSPIALDDHVIDALHDKQSIVWTTSDPAELGVAISDSRVANIAVPDSNWFGEERIRFTATNPDNVSEWFEVRFTVAPVNDAPVVRSYAGQAIMQDSSFKPIVLDSLARDIDNPLASLQWTIESPGGLSPDVDSMRIADIGVPAAWTGVDTLLFIVADPAGLADTLLAPFEVRAASNAPLLAAFETFTAAEGEAFDTIFLDEYVQDRNTPDSAQSWTIEETQRLGVTLTAGRHAIVAPQDSNWFGEDSLSFIVVDETGLADTASAVFIVENVNDAPALSGLLDQTVKLNHAFTPLSLDEHVADIDDADSAMSWSFSGAHHLSIAIDSSRVATITANDAAWTGSDTVTVTVTDPGELADTATIILTVTTGEPPAVADIPDQTIDEGGQFAVIALDDYVTDVDNSADEMTWSAAGATELQAAIGDQRTATVSTPDAQWFGAETITFTARDPNGLVGTTEVVFTVNAINDPPEIEDIPAQVAVEGEAFSVIELDNYVSDIDHADTDISWSFGGNQDLIVTISAAREASIAAPGPQWNGSERITFVATDPENGRDSVKVDFTVTEVTDKPTVVTIPAQTIDEGASFAPIALDDYVADADNNDSEITWSVSGNAELQVAISAERIATISTPDHNYHGAEAITFIARDPTELKDSVTATFTVASVNDTPVISDIPAQSTAEGQAFAALSLDGYVHDVDHADAELSWTYSGAQNLSVSISAERQATVSPINAEWSGAETITFTATDPEGAADTKEVAFTVSSVPDAPVVTAIPGQTVNEDEPFEVIALDNYVSDPDNADDEITWRVSGNGSLEVTISAAREAMITAPENWNGTRTITFTAADPDQLDASVDVVFTADAVNDAPVFSNIPARTIDEGGQFSALDLNTYITDVDHSVSSLTWSYAGNTGIAVSITGGLATFDITDENFCGEENIVFSASDGSETATKLVAFTVTCINDAPVIMTTSDDLTPATEDQDYRFPLVAEDVEDDQLEWTLSDAPAGMTLNGSQINWKPASETQTSVSFSVTATETSTPENLSDTEQLSLTINLVEEDPEITLSCPHAGKQILPGQTLVFTADASDPEGHLDRVEFFVTKDNAELMPQSDNSAPYEFQATADGAYTVFGKAYDMHGNVVASSAINASVGMTWRKIEQNSSGRFYADICVAAVLNNTIYLSGFVYDYRIFSSQDAANWTDLGSSGHLADGVPVVGFHNALYSIGGNDEETFDEINACMASTDGRNWEKKAEDDSLFNYSSLTVHDDKMWIISGRQVGGANMHTSTDGVTWQKVSYAHLSDKDTEPFSFKNDLFVIQQAYNVTPVVLMLDEVSQAWQVMQSRPGMEIPALNNIKPVVYDDIVFIFGDNSNYEPEVYYSTDAKDWHVATISPEFGNRWGYALAVFNNKLMLFGGRGRGDLPGRLNDVWYWSPDLPQ